MNRATSSAVKMTNREFFQQREAAALRRIPGAWELLNSKADQRPMLEQQYPDAVFALQIVSNPFIRDREVGAIQMEAYSAILGGQSIADVRYKYNRQMDNYVARHNWD